jgi:fructokinase
VAYGGVEGGGTKFVCAVGTGPDDLSATTTIETSDPDATLESVAVFFAGHDIEALGIATFGPLDLDPASPGYGRVTATTKLGWVGFDVAGSLAASVGAPTTIDTDVNGAAIGEGRWGAGIGLDTFLYVTVGTGIGGGGLVNGASMHGLTHPEMGHMRIPRHPEDTYPGGCSYHGDCLEGLASGTHIAKRWGRPAEDLGEHFERALELEAYYLGTAMANLTVVVSPRRIILGGGVMGMSGLLEATRDRMLESLGGYEFGGDAADYLVAPGLGARSGVLGAIAMATDLG